WTQHECQLWSFYYFQTRDFQAYESDDESAINRNLDGTCDSEINPGFSNQYVIEHFNFGGSALPVAYTGDSKGFVANLWSR
ncbi:MAG: hypothetical protein ACJASZ_000835, partial [Yoonia sp.]